MAFMASTDAGGSSEMPITPEAMHRIRTQERARLGLNGLGYHGPPRMTYVRPSLMQAAHQAHGIGDLPPTVIAPVRHAMAPVTYVADKVLGPPEDPVRRAVGVLAVTVGLLVTGGVLVARALTRRKP